MGRLDTRSRSGRNVAHLTDEERRDFAQRVDGIHPDDLAYRRYVLAELRCAYLRVKLQLQAIAEIGTLLRQDVISEEDAMEELADCGALLFVQPTPPADDPMPDCMPFFYPTPED